MFVKNLTRILRGSATPAQMMMACVLGATLGFMPGLVQAPGLIVLLALALIVLNANLVLASIVAGLAKIISLALLPLSFGVGRILLDGPTEPLFKTMINMPVLALFGFEYYVTTGGLLVGLVLGLIAGMGLITLVKGIRTKLAGLEEGSEVYRQWMAKWWVKLLLRVFVGRGAKESYGALLEKKGKVIRPVGVVFCVLTIVLLVVMQSVFSGSLITSALQRGLEQANGATVDLEDADIDLAQGRMTITGLAMADPNALEVDLFRAATIEVDVSATSLLRKRLKLDRVVISDAVHGATRATPGRLVGNRPAPSKVVEAKPGEKTLEDYLQDPARWQKRLTQVRHWLGKLSGPAERQEPGQELAKGESLRDRLEREAQRLGYANVTASHLVDGAPRFAIAELLAEKVRTDALQGETIDIKAMNISTHPHLSKDTPSVSMESSSGTLRLELKLGAVCATSGENSIEFAYRGLPIDSIAENLSSSGVKPIAGGTMDVTLNGTIRTTGRTYIDLPLQITLHNTTITVSGKSALVDRLTIPLALRGPIDNPRIQLDDSKFAEALIAAGANALASEVRGRADELIQGAVSGVDLKQALPGIDLKKGLLGLGAKGDAKAADQSSPGDDAKLEDKAKGLLEGLFKKPKKKDGG